MSKETENERGSEDAVATLMNLAGPRAEIPADVRQRVHAAVHRDWQRATTAKTTLRWAIPAALAATVLIAIAVNVRSPDVQFQPIGVIAQVAQTQAGGSPFEVGNPVYAGDRIATGSAGGVSLTLFDDISLRLDASTSLTIGADDEITLLDGRLYADTGDRIYRDRHITVHTPNGSASDIGTQFSVAYLDRELQVAVREGQVELATERSVITALAGDRLTLPPGGEVTADSVAPYDESWQWASALAPEFELDNRSLLDFLKWAARETGRSLHFASDEVRMAAMQTELYGSIRNFTPDQALGSVLATTRFDYRVDETSINISNQESAR